MNWRNVRLIWLREVRAQFRDRRTMFMIFVLPILIRYLATIVNLGLHAEVVNHLTTMLIGMLIVFFLIVEPHGLARLWQIAKQKLRVWPYPY